MEPEKDKMAGLSELNNILKSLFEEYAKTKSNKVEICLGIDDDEDIFDLYKLLDFLKGKGIVLSYEKRYYDKDVEAIKDEYGDILADRTSVDLVDAICDIAPLKLAEYMQELSLIPRFWIQLTQPMEQIVLNNKYPMRTPHHNSENYIVFKYAYTHPNRTVTKAMIEKDLSIKIKKQLRTVVNELKFTGEIKKLFFGPVSVDGIMLRTKILQKDFEKLNINEKKLKTEMQNLLKSNKSKSKKESDLVRKSLN